MMLAYIEFTLTVLFIALFAAAIICCIGFWMTYFRNPLPKNWRR